MRATSAELKGALPLDMGKPRLLKEKSSRSDVAAGSSRRRAAINRSNSAFLSRWQRLHRSFDFGESVHDETITRAFNENNDDVA
jgi:hypothetical protein